MALAHLIITINSNTNDQCRKGKPTIIKRDYFCFDKQTKMKYNFIVLAIQVSLFMLISLPDQAANKDKRELKKTERKARDKYLGVGLGFSNVKVTDQATSPLMYKGWNFPFATLGYLTHCEKRIKTFETDFSYGNLRSSVETPWYESPSTSYWLVMRYNILYQVRKIVHQKINWYIGPEVNVNANFRINFKYDNSALTFDNYYGAGIASRLEYPFSWKSRDIKFLWMKIHRRDRNLRLSWQLSTPLVSYLIRPTYVTITNFIDPGLRTKITTEQTSWGIFVPFNLRSQTELYYILHNQNMFKLSYVWNFYSHDPGYNKVQSAFHGFQFSFIYKFNYKPVAQ